jgi:hypothetical protein
MQVVTVKLVKHLKSLDAGNPTNELSGDSQQARLWEDPYSQAL